MAHLLGDKYQVFHSIDGHTIPHPLGPWDAWRDAKVMRNSSFFDFPEVRAAWVMRSNPGLGIVQEKYGETLRRKKAVRA